MHWVWSLGMSLRLSLGNPIFMVIFFFANVMTIWTGTTAMFKEDPIWIPIFTLAIIHGSLGMILASMAFVFKYVWKLDL